MLLILCKKMTNKKIEIIRNWHPTEVSAFYLAPLVVKELNSRGYDARLKTISANETFQYRFLDYVSKFKRSELKKLLKDENFVSKLKKKVRYEFYERPEKIVVRTDGFVFRLHNNYHTSKKGSVNRQYALLDRSIIEKESRIYSNHGKY